MIYVTRRERFNAAHRLFRPDYSDTKNLEIFGKCSNPNWHGHNYTLYVTVKGEVNPETGFLMNLKDLSELVNRLVIEKLDHKNINLEVDFLSGVLASTENIAIGIWGELEKPIAELGSVLHKIQLYETENNFVEYYGNSVDNIRG
ncbi:MAG: 6-carboxytetrahydropterin synthase [Bacteroidales bacterium]|nr:6-carboxytetrahydropterin synthase [Bacteroidales bacterium]